MINTDAIRTGTELDEVKIVVNSLYLSLSFVLDRMAKASGRGAALETRQALIDALKAGDIDMAIMEDRTLFDFVVSIVEALPEPE